MSNSPFHKPSPISRIHWTSVRFYEMGDTIKLKGGLVYGIYWLRIYCLNWLVTQKFNFFVAFPPSEQDFFCYITCTFNTRVPDYLYLKFYNLSPYWLNIRKIYRKYAKGDKLWNIKPKLLESRAFKSTCYTTKKSCTDGGNSTRKLNFWVTSHLKLWYTLSKWIRWSFMFQ